MDNEELKQLIDELRKEIEYLKLIVQKLVPRHSFLSLPTRKYTEADLIDE
jgi:hypothetical protein